MKLPHLKLHLKRSYRAAYRRSFEQYKRHDEERRRNAGNMGVWLPPSGPNEKKLQFEEVVALLEEAVGEEKKKIEEERKKEAAEKAFLDEIEAGLVGFLEKKPLLTRNTTIAYDAGLNHYIEAMRRVSL